MADVFIPGAVPKNLEWWGIGREVATSTPFIPTPGNLAAPTVTIPLNAGDPSDNPAMLVDKALRGDMGEDYNEVLGTRIASFSLDGNVYVDSIGHLLYNLFGDYTSQGTAMTSTGTITGATAVGATGATTVTLTAPSGSAPFYFQVGNGTTDPFEVVTCTAATVSSITVAPNGFRFVHAAGAALKQVQAPFTHLFALLNGAAGFGLPTNAQPVTHTITHNNALAANATYNPNYLGQRRYGYWCASGMDFNMNLNNLFQHATKGTSIIGVDHLSTDSPGTAFANSQTDAGALPNWRFQVGVGGPASGGTLLNNIEQGSISINRQLSNKFALANQQDPVLIGRLGLGVSGKLQYIAVDESPLLQMLAGNTVGQLQMTMNNGLLSTNAGYQAVTFNLSRAFFEAAQLSDPDMLAYDVTFRGLMNTTDVGASGARGPMTVTVVNAVPSY